MGMGLQGNTGGSGTPTRPGNLPTPSLVVSQSSDAGLPVSALPHAEAKALELAPLSESFPTFSRLT